jgi:hypothetical protein
MGTKYEQKGKDNADQNEDEVDAGSFSAKRSVMTLL